jgi:hypothetical protein
MTALIEKGFALGKMTLLPSQPSKLKMALDAAIPMITQANVGIPEMFATYLDPEVVEILTAPLMAEKLFPAAKVGEWKDQQTMFRESEHVGTVEAYSDFGKGVTADANFNFPTRQIFRFQTLIECGDLEQEVAAAAKIALLAEKQQAAAKAIAIARNEIELHGVSGMSIYGILNEPNLPAAISPTVEGSATAWKDKSATAIYNDILALFEDLQSRCQGLVDFNTEMVLAVPPSLNAYLAKATALGVSPAMELISKHFPNLRVEVVPQLTSAGVDSVMLIAQSIMGGKVGRCGFTDVLRPSRVVLEHTAMSQKWSSSSAGCLLYRPMGVSTMSGLQAS